MDFDFDPSSVPDMSNNQPPQPLVSMHHLLNKAPHTNTNMQWSASTSVPTTSELPSMHLNGEAHHSFQPRYPHHQELKPNPLAPQPMHPSDIHRSHTLHAPDLKPLVAQPTATGAFQLDDNPPIEPHVVMQMGGLPYADLCKERARERFKEMKKNEHMAKGEFDRMKRRKKGDTSMTPREKYVRRLKMNQDSAAAARHAQEVYVHVLEKLVKTMEEEKKALMAENDALRNQNVGLNDKVNELESKAQERGTIDPGVIFDHPERFKKYEPLQLAKMLDLLTSPEPVSAQANDPDFAKGKMGIQPAPAV